MNLLLTFIILSIALCSSTVAQIQPKQLYTAAVFSRGANWDTAKTAAAQPHFGEHGRNLQRLNAEGKIAFGARYGELGMVVFKTGSAIEVRAFFAGDSLVLKDILRMELQPFLPFFKGCIE